MPIVPLTQKFIDHDLQCPEGKAKIEYCCPDRTGLLVEVRSGNTHGMYWLRYRLKGKNKYAKIGATTALSLAEARKQVSQIKAEIATNPNYGNPEATPVRLTFEVFFMEHYIPHAKTRKRTWRKDVEYYELRLKQAFGHLPLDQLERSAIQRLHNTLREQGLAAATSNHYLKLLKCCLNLAVDWGYLESNPALRIKLFREENQIERYLSEEELQRLMKVLKNHANRRVCWIVQFLLSTGARLNEALQARWEEVEVEKRLWRIPAQNSKSKKVRSVPLNDSALSVIQQLDTNDDYLFVNPQTGLPYTDIHKVWSRIRNEAGLPDLRLHDLRHSYASFLVNSGETLYTVQQLLGHSTPVVTQRYSHLSTQTLQKASNQASKKIQAALEG